MGLGKMDLGIPISLPLRLHEDHETQHRVTPSKLAHFGTCDPRTFEALMHRVAGGVESYADTRKLFCGYGE